MIEYINNIMPIKYIALLIITLIGVFFTVRCGFAQKLWFAKKAAKDEKIFFWLESFHNAIVNIESGEHNHIFIMDNFFRFQKESIIRIRSEIKGNQLHKINISWNKYEEWHNAIAKEQTHSLFGAPEKEGLEELKKHMTNIMNKIKKLKA